MGNPDFGKIQIFTQSPENILQEMYLHFYQDRNYTLTFCTETDVFGCFANSQHRNTFPGNVRLAAQILQTVTFTVIFGHHSQAGGAAVHGIELFIMRKFRHL